MCATFFAKMELTMTTTNTEVKEIKKNFDHIEGSFINPAKVMDAKLFSLTNRLTEVEQFGAD
jgi:hypothetical protein